MNRLATPKSTVLLVTGVGLVVGSLVEASAAPPPETSAVFLTSSPSEAVTLTLTANVRISPTSTLPEYVHLIEEGGSVQLSGLRVKASP